MQDWIQRVLTIARSRGFTIRWEQVQSPYDPYAILFYFSCPNGITGTAAAGSLMIGATTPEQFTEYWGSCSGSVPIGTPEYRALDSLQTNERRGGRYIPWRSAKAAHSAMEALFK